MRCLITAVLFASGLAAQVRPERIAFFAVAAAAPTTVTSGPGSMTVQVGGSSCGVVVRSLTPAIVQHYCYRPYPSVVHNALDTVAAPTPLPPPPTPTTAAPPMDLVATYNYGSDIVTWAFAVNTSGIAWQVCVNAGTITEGIFTQVYTPTTATTGAPTETYVNAAVKWSLFYNAPVTWSPGCGAGGTAACPYLDMNGKPVPNGTFSGVMTILPCIKPKLGP